MGSAFVTLKHAALTLKVSVQSIRAYVKKGYLRASPKKDEVLADDVLLLQKEREYAPPFDKTTFAKLWFECQTLREEVNVLKRIANLYSDPLKLTNAELHNSYRMAQLHGDLGCPPEFEHNWADWLGRLQQKDLFQLEEVTNDPNPWRPFYYLAAQLCISAQKHLRPAFEISRGHLQQLAGLWIQLHNNTPTLADAMPPHQLSKLNKIH